LEAPTPYFIDLTNFPTYFPVRKDIVQKYGDKWATDPKTYIGNGPFKMTKWVHNSYIELEKNNLLGCEINNFTKDDLKVI